MRLSSTHQNEFGEIEGTALFPYFGTEITVVCRKGVSFEYAEFFLRYAGKYICWGAGRR